MSAQSSGVRRTVAALTIVLFATSACSAGTTTIVDGTDAQTPGSSEIAADQDATTETPAPGDEAEASDASTDGATATEPPATESLATEPPATGPDVAPAAEPVSELGGGVITVDGVDYVFQAEFCADDDDGIFNQGRGTTADGTPFTAGIVAQPLNDGFITSIDLVLGQESIYSAPAPGMASYDANSFRDDLDITIEGTRVFGSGTVQDGNGIALADGESAPMTFDGQCGDTTEPGADSGLQEVGSNYCELAQIEVDRSAAFGTDFEITNEEFEAYLISSMELASRIDQPADIVDELQIVHAALAAANQAASENGYSFNDSLGAMAETLGSPESISAGLTIADYNERVCGIDGPNQ